jgi:hypothetical protein
MAPSRRIGFLQIAFGLSSRSTTMAPYSRKAGFRHNVVGSSTKKANVDWLRNVWYLCDVVMRYRLHLGIVHKFTVNIRKIKID